MTKSNHKHAYLLLNTVLNLITIFEFTTYNSSCNKDIEKKTPLTFSNSFLAIGGTGTYILLNGQTTPNIIISVHSVDFVPNLSDQTRP